MVLASKADVVFLDEPTVGLDVESIYNVWKILRECVSGGRTILLTTHNMQEAKALADQVVLIHRGKTISQGGPKQLIENSPYKYKLIVKSRAIPTLNLDNAYVQVLGDRYVIYVGDEYEFKTILTNIRDLVEFVHVDKINLEDVYMMYVSGVMGKSNVT